MMDAATRRAVRQRAGNRCEYCRVRQEDDPLFTFHMEHITPRQHGGGDALSNLASPVISAIATRDRTSQRSTQRQDAKRGCSIRAGTNGLNTFGLLARLSQAVLQWDVPQRVC